MAKRSKEDPQFEIAFYEDILRRSPNFIEALMCLGDLYTREGQYDKGLDVDERLSRLRPDDALVIYNLACSYSLVGRLSDADQAMRRAFDLGYVDLAQISKDPDLEKLMNYAPFREFFEAERLKLKGRPRKGKERAV